MARRYGVVERSEMRRLAENVYDILRAPRTVENISQCVQTLLNSYSKYERPKGLSTLLESETSYSAPRNLSSTTPGTSPPARRRLHAGSAAGSHPARRRLRAGSADPGPVGSPGRQGRSYKLDWHYPSSKVSKDDATRQLFALEFVRSRLQQRMRCHSPMPFEKEGRAQQHPDTSSVWPTAYPGRGVALQ